MRSSRSATLLLFCFVFASVGLNQQTPPTDTADQPTQDQYTMQVYSLVNVASEIQRGKGEQLASSIQGDLPGHLKRMAGFRPSPLKKAVFQSARQLFRASHMAMPADLKSTMANGLAGGGQALSAGCFKLLPICSTTKCIPLPISLRPVDVNAPDPMGWHYLIGSHCGVKGWKGWKFWQGCGEPLGVTACTGSDESETGAQPGETGGITATPHHRIMPDTPDQTTQEQYGMQVLDLIHVASEIHAGRQRQLGESIRSGLPEHLRRMATFKDTPMKKMTFFMAAKLFQATDTEVPTDLRPLMSSAIADGVNMLQSEGCFKVLPVCDPRNCIPLPFSPRPVDTNTPDSMGFHYLIGSHCGVKAWKGWKFWEGCGEPVTATACTGEPQPEPETMAVPDGERLPEGAVFATATVHDDTTIEVQQPGYAVVATANVTTVKHVNKGEKLLAKTVSSILFEDGTALLLERHKRREPEFNATVGSRSLLTGDQPLPVNNGTATVYVGSDKPFSEAAIGVNEENKLPTVTHAIVRNGRGEKVGELATYKGLPANANISVRTLDANGAVLEKQEVRGGVLDGTPQVAFDKPSYRTGDKGVLHISNQENYLKMAEATHFGGAGKLSEQPLRLIQVSAVKGLPPEAPFSTTTLNFEALHAGQARVAVIFPQASPPRPIANPGDDATLKQSNAVFERWRGRFK